MIRTRIKATNMDLTPAITEYVEKRAASLEKLVDQNDTSTTLDVEVGRTTSHHQSGGVYRAEWNMHIAGKYFRAEATEADLYAAIDKVRDEMMRSLRVNKGKMHDMWKRGEVVVKDMMRGFGAGVGKFGKKFKWKK